MGRIVKDGVYRGLCHRRERKEAGVSGWRLDPDAHPRPLAERMGEREHLQAHGCRLAGYERLGVGAQVGLVGAQRGGERRVELAVRGAQPTALDVGFLTVWADLGDSRLD